MAYEPKTKKTTASVTAFIDAVGNEQRRKDAKTVLKMLKEITGEKPAMWGPSIIGFGRWRAASGDWPIAGFSPRKGSVVVYIEPDLLARSPLMKRLGKHTTGKTCLYINKLEDVDMDVLRALATRSVRHMREKYKV
jgi:hypothetical protein